MSTIEWQAETAPLDRQIGEPSPLEFPEGWTLSESWERAQAERDEGGPINDAERRRYPLTRPTGGVWLNSERQAGHSPRA